MSHARVSQGLVVTPFRASKLKPGWTVRHHGETYKVLKVKEGDGGLIIVRLVDGPSIRCVPEYEVEVEHRPTQPVVRGAVPS